MAAAQLVEGWNNYIAGARILVIRVDEPLKAGFRRAHCTRQFDSKYCSISTVSSVTHNVYPPNMSFFTFRNA